MYVRTREIMKVVNVRGEPEETGKDYTSAADLPEISPATSVALPPPSWTVEWPHGSAHFSARWRLTEALHGMTGENHRVSNESSQ